jgi:hypothetical protein
MVYCEPAATHTHGTPTFFAPPLLNIPDKLAVEVLDPMSLIHYQKLPAPVLQKALVPHADLIGRHHDRSEGLVFVWS